MRRPPATPTGGGRPDSGRPDAGHPDAGHPDAGHPDAGHPDAGRNPGRSDAWPSDAGPSSRGWLRGWVPALRIARRTAWRHKSRTALIAVLVALPVLGMSTISLVTRTSSLTAEERADRFLGESDAAAQVAGMSVIDPPDMRAYDSGGWSYSGEPTERDPATVDLAAALPPGSETVPGPLLADVVARHGDLLAGAMLSGGGLDGPLSQHRHRLLEGEAPGSDDEIALTGALATRLDVRPGETLTLAASGVVGTAAPASSGERTVTVVGLAVDATCLDCELAYSTRALAGTYQATDAEAYGLPPVYVDLPAGTDTVELWRTLAAQGIALVPRDGILHPDRYPVENDFATGPDVASLAAFGLVVGFGVLEVVLLAGTAFAVGARRQVREIGLVAANGGERRDIRRIVLAQGVVLGLAGGAAGVVLGFLPLLVGWSRWESYANHLFGAPVVRPWELVGIAGFGLAAGVLAAVIPARTAATVPVMTALADRFVPPSRPLRRPLFGLALVVVGAVVAFASAVRARTLESAYGEQLAQSASPEQVPFPDTRPYIAVAVVGFGIMSLGLLVGSPAVVAGLARLGRFLPLGPRLAMRDSGRHRHRTAPAVCAVAMAVSGSVALGIVITSQEAEARAAYQPTLPLGYASVWGYDEPGLSAAQRAMREDAVERAADVLGADGRVNLEVAYVPGDAASAPEGLPAGEEWADPMYVASDCTAAPGEDPVWRGDGVECAGDPVAGEVGVGDADMIAFLSGEPMGPEVRAALERGGAVVLRRQAAVDAGSVRIGTYSSLVGDLSKPGTSRAHVAGDGAMTFTADVPVVEVDLGDTPPYIVPGAVISPATAASLGLVARPSAAVLSNDTVPSQRQIDEANAIVGGALMGATVERGFESDTDVALLVIGGASALVTVASVAIAVGLAAAEGRADLATLAAVGAPPRRRRVLAMWQAAVVGLLGCLLGVAFGTYVAAVGLQGFGLAPWRVPWALLGTIGLAVPLLAVAVAGLFTRSRLPLARRVAA